MKHLWPNWLCSYWFGSQWSSFGPLVPCYPLNHNVSIHLWKAFGFTTSWLKHKWRRAGQGQGTVKRCRYWWWVDDWCVSPRRKGERFFLSFLLGSRAYFGGGKNAQAFRHFEFGWKNWNFPRDLPFVGNRCTIFGHRTKSRQRFRSARELEAARGWLEKQITKSNYIHEDGTEEFILSCPLSSFIVMTFGRIKCLSLLRHRGYRNWPVFLLPMIKVPLSLRAHLFPAIVWSSSILSRNRHKKIKCHMPL